jgi:hypothetical protein
MTSQEMMEMLILARSTYNKVTELFKMTPMLNNESLANNAKNLFLVGIYNGVKNSKIVQEDLLTQDNAVKIEREAEEIVESNNKWSVLTQEINNQWNILTQEVIDAQRESYLKNLQKLTTTSLMESEFILSSYKIKRNHLGMYDPVANFAILADTFEATADVSMSIVSSKMSQFGEILGACLVCIHDRCPEFVRSFIDLESILKKQIYSQYIFDEAINRMTEIFNFISPAVFLDYAAAGMYNALNENVSSIDTDELKLYYSVMDELKEALLIHGSGEVLHEWEKRTDYLNNKIANRDIDIKSYNSEKKLSTFFLARCSRILTSLKDSILFNPVNETGVAKTKLLKDIRNSAFNIGDIKNSRPVEKNGKPVDELVVELNEFINSIFQKYPERNISKEQYDEIIKAISKKESESKSKLNKNVKLLKQIRKTDYTYKLQKEIYLLKVKSDLFNKIKKADPLLSQTNLVFQSNLQRVQEAIEKELNERKIDKIQKRTNKTTRSKQKLKSLLEINRTLKESHTYKKYVCDIVNRELENFRLARKSVSRDYEEYTTAMKDLGFKKAIEKNPKMFKDQFRVSTHNIVNSETENTTSIVDLAVSKGIIYCTDEIPLTKRTKEYFDEAVIEGGSKIVQQIAEIFHIESKYTLGHKLSQYLVRKGIVDPTTKRLTLKTLAEKGIKFEGPSFSDKNLINVMDVLREYSSALRLYTLSNTFSISKALTKYIAGKSNPPGFVKGLQ